MWCRNGIPVLYVDVFCFRKEGYIIEVVRPLEFIDCSFLPVVCFGSYWEN